MHNFLICHDCDFFLKKIFSEFALRKVTIENKIVVPNAQNTVNWGQWGTCNGHVAVLKSH